LLAGDGNHPAGELKYNFRVNQAAIEVAAASLGIALARQCTGNRAGVLAWLQLAGEFMSIDGHAVLFYQKNGAIIHGIEAGLDPALEITAWLGNRNRHLIHHTHPRAGYFISRLKLSYAFTV
jgi:hypothetical protein